MGRGSNCVDMLPFGYTQEMISLNNITITFHTKGRSIKKKTCEISPNNATWVNAHSESNASKRRYRGRFEHSNNQGGGAKIIKLNLNRNSHLKLG